MSYLKWLAMVPVSLLVTVVCILFAPIIVLFASPTGWLPSWLTWFQTPDNSLDGDNGWKNEHWQWRYKLPAALCTYVGRVGWLWRNPGYGYGVVILDSAVPLVATYTGNADVNDDPGVEGYCLIYAAGLFQLVWVKRIAENKSIYCNFGWNIKGLIGAEYRHHIATFAFSPRISKFTVK